MSSNYTIYASQDFVHETVEEAIGKIQNETNQNILQDAKGYTDAQIAEEVGNRNNAIANAVGAEITNRDTAIANAVSTETTNRGIAIETAKTEANEYTDTQITAAKTVVNGYTDSKISAEVTARDTAISEAISGEITNRNNAIATAKTEANNYTDEKIAAEVTDRNEAIEQAIAAEVTARNSAIETAKTAANNYTDEKVASITTSNNEAVEQAIAAEVSARNSAIATAKGEANSYTDTKINELVDGAPELMNTIGEVAQAIKDHQDITDALNAAIGSKANASSLTEHVENDTIHITSAERTKWNNQSDAKGYADNKIAAEVTARNEAIEAAKTEVKGYTDTEIGKAKTAANNYTNEKIAAEVTARNSAIEQAITTETTARNSAIATAKTQANTYTDNQITEAKTAVNGYTDNKIAAEVTARNNAITSAKTEANDYTDEQIAGHTHKYAGSSSVGGAANSANKVNKSLAVKLNGGTTEGTNLFTFDGSTEKTVNITPSAIGAADASHGTHVSYGTDAPKAAGTAAVGTATTLSRSDHVHPAQISVSGNAGTATKLTSSAGSGTQPVYFNDGKPVKCTYELNKTVPADAKFTDTVYDLATVNKDGLMSAEDKANLIGLIENPIIPDWNQYNETAPDYIKNRTHYDLGYVLEETTYEPYTNYIPLRNLNENPKIDIIKAGVTYIVNWNGTEYKCVGTEVGGYMIFLGNISIWDSNYPNTGEPFTLYRYSYSSYECDLLISEISKFTVSIKPADSIHQLDNKYLEPFEYTTSTDPIDVLTWDGDLNGREVATAHAMGTADAFVLISEITPTIQEVQNGGIFGAVIQGNQNTSNFTSNELRINDETIAIMYSNVPFIVIALIDNAINFGGVFPKKGVYFYYIPTVLQTLSFQINEYSFADYSWKLKEEYLPNTVATSSTSECKEIILQSSTEGSNKKFKITIDDDGNLKVEEIASA